jgi:hypothetical protein
MREAAVVPPIEDMVTLRYSVKRYALFPNTVSVEFDLSGRLITRKAWGGPFGEQTTHFAFSNVASIGLALTGDEVMWVVLELRLNDGQRVYLSPSGSSASWPLTELTWRPVLQRIQTKTGLALTDKIS